MIYLSLFSQQFNQKYTSAFCSMRNGRSCTRQLAFESVNLLICSADSNNNSPGRVFTSHTDISVPNLLVEELACPWLIC